MSSNQLRSSSNVLGRVEASKTATNRRVTFDENKEGRKASRSKGKKGATQENSPVVPKLGLQALNKTQQYTKGFGKERQVNTLQQSRESLSLSPAKLMNASTSMYGKPDISPAQHLLLSSEQTTPKISAISRGEYRYYDLNS